MDITSVITLSATVIAIGLAALLNKTNRKLKACKQQADAISGELTALKERVSPLTSIEAVVATLSNEAQKIRDEIGNVRVTYAEKRGLLDKLEQQISIYDDKLSFFEMGVYEPHFDFGESENYKEQIAIIREKQKKMISSGAAAKCSTNWYVGNSQSKGQTMINRQTRLTLRAFNNECEAAIANARWNNVVAMERRIQNAATQINKANASMNLEIVEDYVSLKLDELRITHEYRERQKTEKEERAERARSEREERKLLDAAAAAENKEREYQEILEKARSEVGVDQGRIAELEARLAEAHAASERARAMAEMTKSGYVYIISNVGSFGEDVVKIGLTRRLDPDNRVRELGDASVPFTFDTHAMIYSDEAPALESALHKEFADRRVNMSNLRKEFFRVKLEEVEGAVARLAPNASFFKDREAQEWHETLARRRDELAALEVKSETKLPYEI